MSATVFSANRFLAGIWYVAEGDGSPVQASKDAIICTAVLAVQGSAVGGLTIAPVGPPSKHQKRLSFLQQS